MLDTFFKDLRTAKAADLPYLPDYIWLEMVEAIIKVGFRMRLDRVRTMTKFLLASCKLCGRLFAQPEIDRMIVLTGIVTSPNSSISGQAS